MYYYATPPSTDEIYHHGIKGMKWGVRRYENPDGTLTAAGKKRYGTKENYDRSRARRKQRIKNIGKSVGITAATAAALYGGNKYYKNQNERKKDILRQYIRDEFERDDVVNKLNRKLTWKKKYDYLNEILPYYAPVADIVDRIKDRKAY